MDRSLRWAGIITTAIYLLGVVYWVLAGTGNNGQTRWTEFSTMSLNNIGDFLAGAFSPLAFLWLVLGFFQQGHELQLQAEELRASVQEQAKMARIAEDQYTANVQQLQFERQRIQEEREAQLRAARPNFHSRGGGGSHGAESTHIAPFTNYGARATRIRLVSLEPSIRFAPEEQPIAEPGSTVQFSWTLPRQEEPAPFDVDMHWLDALGNPGFSPFRVTYSRSDDGSYYNCIVAPRD